MADVTAPSPPRRSRVPRWLFEGLDLVDQRRRALLLTFGLVVVAGGVLAALRPDLLPPTPEVGAAIGAAGLLLALAVLIALDTADLKVRGPRHVRAAGGELVAVLPSEPSRTAAADLATAILEARPSDRTLLLGIAAATGDGKRVARWSVVVARALAERGTSVLALDLTADGSARPGFLEMVRDGAKLGPLVDLDPEVRLATLGPGRDTTEALRAFNEAGRWIPRDLQVLLVSLPMAASRAVVRASLSLDQLLIVAERDRTSRVELIAGLDATEAVGTHAQVILIDDAYAGYLGIRGDEDAGDEDAGDETDHGAIGGDGIGGDADEELPVHASAAASEAHAPQPDAEASEDDAGAGELTPLGAAAAGAVAAVGPDVGGGSDAGSEEPRDAEGTQDHAEGAVADEDVVSPPEAPADDTADQPLPVDDEGPPVWEQPIVAEEHPAPTEPVVPGEDLGPEEPELGEPSPSVEVDDAIATGEDAGAPREPGQARDVEVMLGAAAASALSSVSAYEDAEESREDAEEDVVGGPGSPPGAEDERSEIAASQPPDQPPAAQPPLEEESAGPSPRARPEPGQPQAEAPTDRADDAASEPEPWVAPPAAGDAGTLPRLDEEITRPVVRVRPSAFPPEIAEDREPLADDEDTQRAPLEEDEDTQEVARPRPIGHEDTTPIPDVETDEDDDDEDLLNTTARLSLLMEEMEDRFPDDRGA